jgi:hypothetical protein
MPRPPYSAKLPNARCACGCGRWVPDGRVLYHDNACCHRAAVRRWRARERNRRQQSAELSQHEEPA